MNYTKTEQNLQKAVQDFTKLLISQGANENEISGIVHYKVAHEIGVCFAENKIIGTVMEK